MWISWKCAILLLGMPVEVGWAETHMSLRPLLVLSGFEAGLHQLDACLRLPFLEQMVDTAKGHFVTMRIFQAF